MMRTLRFLLACSLLAAATASAQEELKGKATLSGTVADPAGKGIGGAVITLTFVDTKFATEVKSKGNGEWELKNVVNGKWVVRISKEGFDPKEIPVDVGGDAKNPHLDVRLAPVGSGGANADLTSGDQKARELMTQKKFAEARAIYQDLLAKYPKAVKIHIALAQTYDGENQFEKAADELRTYLETDTSNVQIIGFYATENAKAGNADEAFRALNNIPADAMKESVDLQECGFTLLRAKKPADALKFFELAVTRFPQQADNYYYRGLAEWQIGTIVEKPGSSASKSQYEKATADLNKYLEMDPNGQNAVNAKKLLEALK